MTRTTIDQLLADRDAFAQARQSAVELTISDDGRGFDTGQLLAFVRDGHFGLAGMRERIEAVGGSMVVKSSIARGTHLTANIPPSAAHPPVDAAVLASR